MNAQPGPAESQTDSEQIELQSLLARICDRDEQALGCFYDQTLSRVFGLILRVVGNQADAEEVAGDLYMQVWERAADYQPGRGPVLAWLRTLAWSRAVDRQRRGRRFAREVELHPEAQDGAYTECEDLSAEVVATAWSSAQAVQRAFCALSELQKQILTMAFQQDMSHQEISKLTQIPLGTVKSHARRGLASLRVALGAEDREHV